MFSIYTDIECLYFKVNKSIDPISLQSLTYYSHDRQVCKMNEKININFIGSRQVAFINEQQTSRWFLFHYADDKDCPYNKTLFNNISETYWRLYTRIRSNIYYTERKQYTTVSR